MHHPCNRMLRAICGLVLLGCVSCGKSPACPRPYRIALPGAAPPGTWSVLVRDAATGRPIADASVTVYAQGLDTTAGTPRWGVRQRTVNTDSHGIASAPYDDPGGDDAYHWVVRAQGHAAWWDLSEEPVEAIDLVPARNVQGRVIDVNGHSVSGLVVEYKLGGPMAPAVVETTTDEQGHFRLAGLDPSQGDIYVRGSPTTAPTFASVRQLTDEGSPALVPILVLPGSTVRGSLTGRLRATARYVAQADTPRGPVAVVRPDGTFQLHGTRSGAAIYVLSERLDRLAPFDANGWDMSRPLVLGGKARSPTARIIVDSDIAVPVAWTERATGRRIGGQSGSPVPVPPGHYDLSVGSTFGEFQATGAGPSVVVRANEVKRVRVAVERKPTLDVSLQDPGGPSELTLVVGSEVRPIPAELGVIYLPAREPARVIASAGGIARAFPVEPVEASTRHVTLTPNDAVRIDFREPVPTNCHALADGRETPIRRANGRSWVELPGALRRATRLLVHGPEFGARSRPVSTASALEVVAAAVEVRLDVPLDPMDTYVRHFYRYIETPVEVVGGPRGELHGAFVGGALRVERDGHVHFHRVSAGDTRLTPAPGVVEIHVQTPDDEAPVAVIAGRHVEFDVQGAARSWTRRISGLQPGSATILVGSPSCLSQALPVDVRAAGRTYKFRLHLRPK